MWHYRVLILIWPFILCGCSGSKETVADRKQPDSISPIAHRGLETESNFESKNSKARPVEGSDIFASSELNIDELNSDQVKRFGVFLLGDQKVPLWVGVVGKNVFVDQNLDGKLSRDEALDSARESDPKSFSECEVRQLGADSQIWKCRVALYNWFEFRDSMDVEKLKPAVFVRFPDGRHFGAWGDQLGKISFAEDPVDAPRIQMGACDEMPRTMGFEIPTPLKIEENGRLELNAAVGVRNGKSGTFAWLGYGLIPDDVWPEAEFEFRSEGAESVTVRVRLDHRC